MRKTWLSYIANAGTRKYSLVICGLVLLALGIATKGFIILIKVQAAGPPTGNTLQVCTEIPPSSFDAAGRPNLFWKNKEVLRVGFLDGTPFVKAQVRKYASIWNQCGKIKFEFSDSGPYDIRISFTADGRSWSYIGTDATNVAEDEPTMNSGWFNEETSEVEFRRTILHEFGHALGLIHEHQSPAAGIKWNRPAVYKYYWDKFKWSESKVNKNILKKYDANRTQYSAYDAASIMHYPIPAEFTVDGNSVDWNTNLSRMDIAFIRKIYQ